MGALAILVLSVAAIDSLNPSTMPRQPCSHWGTVGPASGLFTLGVFVASTAGGLLLLFAVGRKRRRKVAHPSPHTQHVLELAIGIALLLVAGLLWILRDRLRTHLGRARPSQRPLGSPARRGNHGDRAAAAFPYFAAILATLGAVHGAVRQTVFSSSTTSSSLRRSSRSRCSWP